MSRIRFSRPSEAVTPFVAQQRKLLRSRQTTKQRVRRGSRIFTNELNLHFIRTIDAIKL